MELFSEIINDNTSGSGSLLKKLEDALFLYAASQKEIRTSFLADELNRLRLHFPQFALFQHFIGETIGLLSREEILSGNALKKFLTHYREKWLGTQEKAGQQLMQQIPLDNKNILLHSNSSAIYTLVKQITQQQQKPVIWQTLSGPVNEGKNQAEKISELGIEVHLFHEDALSKFIPHIDLAVFGADFVTETFFINKTGTLPLSLMMQHAGKPVYVLAEERKIFPEKVLKENHILEEPPKPDGEIAIGLKNITLHNYYFENIPLTLVKHVFTEKGIIL